MPTDRETHLNGSLGWCDWGLMRYHFFIFDEAQTSELFKVGCAAVSSYFNQLRLSKAVAPNPRSLSRLLPGCEIYDFQGSLFYYHFSR